ncbi:MAG: AF1514 family protein [Proteobacteria bacterium]|nr:AF1514 family protein [Pseudomonadota bacterium]MBU1688590.1 AF1514 family protein [Pseudomonadota bacterium]
MVDEQCPLPPDLAGIEVVILKPDPELGGYPQAVALANGEAAMRFEEYLLISWYDRDRDFESPPNTTECPKACEKNGYILYALSHGATLKVDIEGGRFVFFYTPVVWD